jgi:acyl dehydratase
MTVILAGTEGIQQFVGKHLGHSEWIEVTQDRIDLFAQATGDCQWIHVDPERAKTGPFGSTVAHGLLTLSMIGDMARTVFRFTGFRMAVNYGYDRVRFPAPVRVGSRVRLGAAVDSVEMIGEAVQTLMDLTIEIEGGAKPACVARMIFRHMPG